MTNATQSPARGVEPDMSWIDIAVCRGGAVVMDCSPGWDEFLLNGDHFFEDVFDCKLPEMALGAYRWTGYTLSFWDEDERVRIKGGTFEPHRIAHQSTAQPEDGSMEAERLREALRQVDAAICDKSYFAALQTARAALAIKGGE